MINKSVNNGVDELLDQVPRLGLDIKPEQLKRRVISRQSLEVAREKTLLLQLLLSICNLKIDSEITR